VRPSRQYTGNTLRRPCPSHYYNAITAIVIALIDEVTGFICHG